jgi:signal transduction histidine kinase
MIAPLDDRLKDMLLRARDRMGALLCLINDWLDLARLSHGQIIDKIKPLSLQPLLRKLVEFMKPAAAENKVSLRLEEAAGSDLVSGDEQSLEQVFSNLLSNAIKYNRPEGSVTVRLREEKDAVSVEVQDSGIGIAPEHLPHVFERFSKPASQQAVFPGLGVGLYISQEIALHHGGRIRAESQAGKGSTFHVWLPLARKEGGRRTP